MGCISLSSEGRGTDSTAIQIGGTLQYRLEVYCATLLTSSGGWVSDILLNHITKARQGRKGLLNLIFLLNAEGFR